MAVNAIETLYAGCRMRSRLEARWAVAFDYLGIQWEYEPQGYDLPSGKYLPDFRLTVPGSVPFFLEIKGPAPDAREFTVASEINLYVCPLAILAGDVPRRRGAGTAWVFERVIPGPGKTGPAGNWRMTDPEQALINLAYHGHTTRPRTIGPVYDDAVTAARSARFEHGESGGPR